MTEGSSSLKGEEPGEVEWDAEIGRGELGFE